MTIEEFIKVSGIRIANLDFKGIDASDGDGMFRWVVDILYDRRHFAVPYRMGLGHCSKARKEDSQVMTVLHGETVYVYAPELADVLDCLQSDARAGGHARFEDFADEFGYDSDSRKAEKVYQACRVSAGRMRTLLGDQFDAFMACEGL